MGNYRRRLETSCSSHAGGPKPTSLMTHSLTSAVAGVLNRGSDPISGPIGEVINFHLLKEGYQNRFLNPYQSAISSTHEKVDGVCRGTSPGIESFERPKYTTTWKVSTVLDFIVNNKELTLALKMCMLMSLTRPTRSVDLSNLNVG